MPRARRTPPTAVPRVRRGLAIPIAVAVCLALVACGRSAPPVGPRVTLSLAAPAAGARVSAATVTVSGTVAPDSARVEILGHPVAVHAGHFAAPVALAVGVNLIDVIAAAPRSSGAVAAVRITRFELVSVPSVSGQSPTQALATLRAAGLQARLAVSDNPFDFLLPLSDRICSSTPAAGSRVDPGATVTLRVAKFCGF